MTANSVLPSFPTFKDVDGLPLEAGFIYIGLPNLNPEVAPKQAYFDKELTIPAPQPIRTIGGYPSRNGTPSQIYVDGDFSLTVRDKNGALIYNAATEQLRFSPLISGIYDFRDVATLLADTGSGFGAGSIWRTRSEGFSYEEAPSSATDHHVTTAGGVKLRALPFEPGKYHVAQVGAVGSGNETAIVQAFIDNLPAGSELHFDGTKTYTLAVKAHKSFFFAPNGATFVNAVNNDYIVGILPSVARVNHAVTESVLPYGSTTFTVTDAASLFSVGDIGVLHDGRVRPADSQPVNFHCVKIAALSGNTVTVERPTMAHMGGTIVFQYTTGQFKDAGIIGHLNVQPTNSHTLPSVYMEGIERPRFDRITGRNTFGHGVSIRRCYDMRCGDTDFRAPRATGSGQGYGFVALFSTGGYVGNCHGVGMRHAFDIDSTYDLSVGLVSDPQPAAAPCVIAHNGYAGRIDVLGYRGGNPEGAHPVVFAAQGHASGLSATGDPLFPARKIKIGFIDVVQISGSPEIFNVVGAYFQGYVEDVDIGPVTVDWPTDVEITNSASSAVIRVNGGLRGYFRTGPITANTVGFAMQARAITLLDAAFRDGLWDIGPVTITGRGRRQVFLGSPGRLRYAGGFTGTGTGDSPVRIERLSTNPVLSSITIGHIESGLGGAATSPVDIFGLVPLAGFIPPSPKLSNVAISFASAGDAEITAGQLYNRTALFRCVVTYAPGAPHEITTFPAPLYNGQEMTMAVPGGTGDVVVKTGANVHADILVTVGEVRRLVAYSGKWLGV